MMMTKYLNPEPKTKPFLFENVLPCDGPLTLEQLEELSSKRKAIFEHSVTDDMNVGLTSACDHDLHNIGQYIPLLYKLVYYTDWIQQLSDFKIRWSSGLISQTLIHRTCPEYFQLNHIVFELGMILFHYATKLRERAMELVSTDVKKSVTLYREASGVFNHLSDKFLPCLQTVYSQGKHFPELTPPVCYSLSLLCLAEGQAVATNNAEVRGKSASLLSKLHCGITQMLSEAYDTLLLSIANGECKDLSSRFLEYVTTMRALHELKSQKHLAEWLEGEGRVGEAVGILRRALESARKSAPSKEDTWISIFKKERKEVSEILAKYEKLNESMMLQKIPKETELPCPKGEKIVNLIPYTPVARDKSFELGRRSADIAIVYVVMVWIVIIVTLCV